MKPTTTILLVTFRIAVDSLRRAVVGKLRFAGRIGIPIIDKTIGSISSIGVGEEKYFIGRIVTGGSAPCARVVNIRLYYPAAFARGEGLVVEGITFWVRHLPLGIRRGGILFPVEEFADLRFAPPWGPRMIIRVERYAAVQYLFRKHERRLVAAHFEHAPENGLHLEVRRCAGLRVAAVIDNVSARQRRRGTRRVQY